MELPPLTNLFRFPSPIVGVATALQCVRYRGPPFSFFSWHPPWFHHVPFSRRKITHTESWALGPPDTFSFRDFPRAFSGPLGCVFCKPIETIYLHGCRYNPFVLDVVPCALCWVSPFLEACKLLVFFFFFFFFFVDFSPLASLPLQLTFSGCR